MKTDYEFLKTEIDGHILTVTINRPERMNALHPPAHAGLDEVWNEFDKDENLWVGIVTGEGDRAFSAGNDLKFQAEAGGKMDINMASSGFAGLTSRFNLTKPLIAAVNGVSMGGGFEIALACDLIVATIKSQASAISNPPPMETPFTAAIRGLVKLNLEVKPAKPEEAILISIFPPASAWNLRSFPAEKARSPSPVTIPTQRFSSLSNSFQTSSNPACAGGCKAFILSGLFMVTVKM